jgi:hypothetical protein
LAILSLVVKEEYGFWAPQAAAKLIWLASLVIPREMRALRRKEWLAELDQLRTEGHHGFFFSLEIVVGSPVTSVRDRTNANKRTSVSTKAALVSPKSEEFNQDLDAKTTQDGTVELQIIVNKGIWISGDFQGASMPNYPIGEL